MIPYLIIAFNPLILASFLTLINIRIETKRKIIICCSFFVLLFFQCVRDVYSVGIDYKNYISYFNEVSSLTFRQLFLYRDDEYAFWILLKIISFFTNNEQVFVSILSALIIIPLMVYYLNNADMPIISFGLFLAYDFFAMTFSGVRQALAVVTIVLFFKYVKVFSIKNLILYYAGVLLACQFHISAVIAVIIYPVYWLKLNRRFFPLVLLLIFFIYIFNDELFSFFIQVLPNKYFKYYEVVDTGASGMLIFDLFILVIAFMFSSDDREVMSIRNMQFVIVIIRLFSPISYLATRFAFYFLPFSIMTIPKVLSNSLLIETKSSQIISGVVYVGSIFLMIYTLLMHDALGIYPYVFYWSVI